MPLPFEQFQGKGVLGLLDSSPQYKIWANREKLHGGGEEDLCFIVGVNNGGCCLEPTSVLDSLRSPSPFISSSTTTLSSSHGGVPSGGAFSGADGKCDQMSFEDFDGVLSGSPGQEQSILRLIMAGDVADPSSNFVGFDPGSGSDQVIDNPNPLFGYGFPLHDPPPPPPPPEKFQITTNQETLINPNPGFFSDPPSSPPAKRLNLGQPESTQLHFHQFGFPFSDPVHESPDLFLTPPKLAANEDVHDQSTFIIDQLFNAAAKLIGTTNGGDNNHILAQEILARLNHNLNNNNNPKPPLHRAASYITEALHSLLQDLPPPLSPPQTLILRIAAYRAFSETSPFLQFLNFTANQTILESVEGFDRIHIVDFDIGYGGQWASLIQELAGRRNRASSAAPSLKITAFASPSTVSDEFELRFTEENLRNFAGETGVSFEIELLNMEILLNPNNWPLSLLRSSDKEAIAVNLPISSVVSGYLPLILRFLKQISPNVVVCSDRSCDRNNDTPFPNGVINTLQYYTTLLESLDSVNPNQEAATSIERFCVQPSIQKLLTNRYRWMERSPPWRSLFGQCGFSPVALSQTAETQAEYLLQRNPTRGFHLEKRQSSSSLVLCWQRKELVAISAWKC